MKLKGVKANKSPRDAMRLISNRYSDMKAESQRRNINDSLVDLPYEQNYSNVTSITTSKGNSKPQVVEFEVNRVSREKDTKDRYPKRESEIIDSKARMRVYAQRLIASKVLIKDNHSALQGMLDSQITPDDVTR